MITGNIIDEFFDLYETAKFTQDYDAALVILVELYEMEGRGELIEASEEDVLRAENNQLKEALIWCSGSADFGQGGQAEKGWNKICRPLLRPCEVLKDTAVEVDIPASDGESVAG